jgi:hypothetical protein
MLNLFLTIDTKKMVVAIMIISPTTTVSITLLVARQARPDAIIATIADNKHISCARPQYAIVDMVFPPLY